MEPNFEAGTYGKILLSDSLYVDTRISAFYDTGVDAFGLNSGFIGKYSFGLNCQWSERTTFEIFNIKGIQSFVDDSRGNEAVFGCGIRIAY